MQKTPDEIKKGLEEEIPVHYHIDGEPRLTPRLLMDMQWLHKDAIALIQKLQAENAEKDARIQQLEAERDALAADFKLYRERNIKQECGVYACDLCKHGGKYEEWEEIKCQKGCMGIKNWEWRGVQKD